MIALLLLLQVAPVRTYWPVTVAQLASGAVKHTHVQVSGVVAYTKIEEDGDIHIRIVGDTGAAFVVAECIPRLPCRRPKNGERITVQGITRYDGEHHWFEVHPVEELHP
ncbi:MAG TPA: hypothetical protein VF910_00905 [Candidatus Bathyarchaeia archaeon]